MSRGPFRVGIIGLGWPAQQHLVGYRRLPDVEVVALCDANPELLEQRLAEVGPPARGYTDWRQMLAEAPIDGVSICTPNFLHAEMAIAALDAGKHVLLEKPLAHTVRDGAAIVARARRGPGVLLVAVNNRFHRDVATLHRLARAGQLGHIYAAETKWLRGPWASSVRGWFVDSSRSGGGPLIDIGFHMLDIALWVMGNPRPVSVAGATSRAFAEQIEPLIGPYDVEDFGTALVRLQNGATIQLSASWVAHLEENDIIETRILGTRGGALIRRHSPGETDRLQVFSRVEGVPVRISPIAKGEPRIDSYANEVAHFVACARGEATPLVTPEQALDVLLVLETAYASAAEGRELRIPHQEELL